MGEICNARFLVYVLDQNLFTFVWKLDELEAPNSSSRNENWTWVVKSNLRVESLNSTSKDGKMKP